MTITKQSRYALKVSHLLNNITFAHGREASENVGAERLVTESTRKSLTISLDLSLTTVYHNHKSV